MRMHDPFEESLRDLLKSSALAHDDDAALGRVLKMASRQAGAGDLFALVGHWFEALMIGLNNGSPHIAPVSRRSTLDSSADKAD
ncbi:CrfX protein [Azotobacter beijerinckii]|nr:CrfX protein [Azotobacter beijerinckii]MDV7210287.1 CrfX protein [Azotobacter beijerinckii]